MFFDSMYPGESFMWALLVLCLLGVWKFVEIAIWFFSHLTWV